MDANKRRETLHAEAFHSQGYENSSYLDDIKHGRMIRARKKKEGDLLTISVYGC
jgi:hypothetical protein